MARNDNSERDIYSATEERGVAPAGPTAVRLPHVQLGVDTKDEYKRHDPHPEPLVSKWGPLGSRGAASLLVAHAGIAVAAVGGGSSAAAPTAAVGGRRGLLRCVGTGERALVDSGLPGLSTRLNGAAHTTAIMEASAPYGDACAH